LKLGVLLITLDEPLLEAARQPDPSLGRKCSTRRSNPGVACRQ
jgi:hypothetical protein